MKYTPDDGRIEESAAELFERLHGDARMHPLKETIMDEKTLEGLKQIRALVDSAIQQGLISASALSRRTGIPSASISEFRNDKWKGSRERLRTVASTLARSINQLAREREAATNAASSDFVKTRVAEAIYSITQYALKRRQMAVFLMPAGLGKTMAVRQLYAETPGSILITVTSTRGTVRAFLQLWARALGLPEYGRAEDVQERIVKALEDSGRATFVDEAHKLKIAALDAMREVYDAAGRVPIIMAATPSFYQTITTRRIGTHECELLDQWYSRVGMFRNLTTLENPQTGDAEPCVTPEDISKIFARGKLRIARDGVDFLCKIANTPGMGGYRTCRDLVQIVIDLFPDEVVTARLLTSALVTRVGVREADFRTEQIAAYEDQPRKVAAG